MTVLMTSSEKEAGVVWIDGVDAHVTNHRRDSRAGPMTRRNGTQSLSSSCVSLAVISPVVSVRVAHNASEAREMLQRADDVEFRERVAIPAGDLGDEIGIAVDGAPVKAGLAIIAARPTKPQIDDGAEVHRDAEPIEFARLRLGVVSDGFFSLAYRS